MCICVLTKTWLGDFLTVARRSLQKSDGHPLFLGFHSYFFNILLLKKKPHRNFTIQKHCNSNWSVSRTCGDKFSWCSQSPKKIQVGKVWVIEANFFLEKSHLLREKNIECAKIRRYYETETSRRRIETIRLENFALMKLKKHEFLLFFRKYFAEKSSKTFGKTSNMEVLDLSSNNWHLIMTLSPEATGCNIWQSDDTWKTLA